MHTVLVRGKDAHNDLWFCQYRGQSGLHGDPDREGGGHKKEGLLRKNKKDFLKMKKKQVFPSSTNVNKNLFTGSTTHHYNISEHENVENTPKALQ